MNANVTVTTTLELGKDKFDAMEKVLLHVHEVDSDINYLSWKESITKEEWEKFVIQTYKKVERFYLKSNDNDLMKAFIDSYYDF